DLPQWMGVAEPLEIGVLLLEVVQVSRFGRQVAVAPGQIAVDAVALDALADDLDGLEAHALERVHAIFADHRGELLDVVAHSANQLAAVATTGAPADTPCLEQDHRQTALGQFDRGIEPGETAADDADIGRLLSLQARQLERPVDAGGIVGGRVIFAVNGGLAGAHERLLDEWRGRRVDRWLVAGQRDAPSGGFALT